MYYSVPQNDIIILCVTRFNAEPSRHVVEAHHSRTSRYSESKITK